MKNLATVIGVLLLLAIIVPVVAAPADHKVTGGEWQLNQRGIQNWKAFTAQIDKDGNVKGQIQNQGGNAGTWHADVTDLIVMDNKAIIEYSVTFAPDTPSLIGETICFVAIDNGQGNDAPPDQISGGYFYPASWCADDQNPYIVMRDVIGGNIQVS